MNCLDMLALCETNLDDSIDSGNLSVNGYLLLIQKDSNSHMHGLAVYAKEGLLFAWDLSLEKSADSYVFDWLLFFQCFTSFSYIDHLLCLCARFFDCISFNIDEILSVNPPANVFVFGGFNVHHKDWLTYSGRTDRSGDLKQPYSDGYFSYTNP